VRGCRLKARAFHCINIPLHLTTTIPPHIFEGGGLLVLKVKSFATPAGPISLPQSSMGRFEVMVVERS